MPFSLLHTLRSRWLAILVQVCLWLLLYLTIVHLGGRKPGVGERTSFTLPSQSPVPVADVASLFGPDQWPRSLVATNVLNPFYTTFFVPPPSPAPPPPPTTKKVDVTYQGFYQAGDGPKKAIAKVADAFVIAPIGAPIASNTFIANASVQLMTLTNGAGQTNLVPLNLTKQIEVPIK